MREYDTGTNCNLHEESVEGPIITTFARKHQHSKVIKQKKALLLKI